MARSGIRLLLISLLLMTSGVTASGAEWLALGGGEAGFDDAKSHYLYAGLLVPGPGGRLGQGLVQRYWLDSLSYRYDANGRTIKAEGLGVEGALGWEVSGRKGHGGIYGGLRFLSTDLSPDDPGSRVRGDRLWPKIQAGGETVLSADWRLGGHASFTFGPSAHWSSLRLMRRLQGALFTGPLAMYQGDPDYSAWSAGWGVWGISLPAVGELSVQGGIRTTADRYRGPYLGIGLGRAF